MLFFSHQIKVSRYPGRLSSTNDSSNIGHVVIYCYTLVCRREMYSSIFSNPTYTRASPMGSYYHWPFCNLVVRPEICLAARWCRLTNTCRMRGVTTHVSDSKSRTNWIAATYNLPVVLVSDSSWPNKQENRACLLRDFCSFCSTVGQSLSSD